MENGRGGIVQNYLSDLAQHFTDAHFSSRRVYTLRVL